MELHSTVQGQKCPCGKGKISDDICVGCPFFSGYIDTKGHFPANFTKDKNHAYNVEGIYFYICGFD